jgi:hypothetical protein
MKKYEVHLPLNYSDGQPIEHDKLRKAHVELLAVFGSFTVPYQRVWKYDAGRMTEIMKIEVVTSAKPTMRLLKSLKKRLKESLRQSDILIIARSIEQI